MIVKNKIPIIIFFVMIFLFGVYIFVDKQSPVSIFEGKRKLINNINTGNISGATTRDIFKNQNTSYYSQEEVIITIGTGLIIAGLNANPDASYNWFTVNENGESYKAAIISGYLYTYTYSDLGLKITTPPLYDPYFFEKITEPAIKRINTMFYPVFLEKTHGNILPYLAIFNKNINESFEDEIIKNHLLPGCNILTGIISNNEHTSPFASMQGWKIIYITSQDGNLASDGEIFDKQFPENMLNIAFVMDPKHPEKYYKFSYGDCAPGPCSVFGTIEFF